MDTPHGTDPPAVSLAPAELVERLRELEAFRARTERAAFARNGLVAVLTGLAVAATGAVALGQDIADLLPCGEGSSLICFESGTPARAAQVNHNFASLERATTTLASQVSNKIGTSATGVQTGALTASDVAATNGGFAQLSASGLASVGALNVAGNANVANGLGVAGAINAGQANVGGRLTTGSLTVNGRANLGYKIVDGPNVVAPANAKWDIEVDCGSGYRVVGAGAFVQAPGCGRATGYSLANNGGQGWTMAIVNQCSSTFNSHATAICLRVE